MVDFDSNNRDDLILKENDGLQHLPLVESHDNMVLLRSMKRKELIKMIARQISREQRLQVAAKWQNEVEAIAFRKEDEFNEQNTNHRLSAELVNSEILSPHEETITHEFSTELEKTSILKNVDSVASNSTDYPTISSTEGRIRSTLDTVFQKSSSALAPTDASDGELTDILCKSNSTSISPASRTVRVIDMSRKDQKRWEIAQLNEAVNFDQADIQIDPAPFQLVEKTSILKVHGLFTMLGLRRAYVTKLGRLVGVVGSKQLRSSIEDVNNGNLMIECTDNDRFEVKPQPLSQNAPLLNASSGKIATASDISSDSAFSVSDDVEKSIDQSEEWVLTVFCSSDNGLVPSVK